MTHEELRESLEAWALGALREDQAREVELHLPGCPACRDQVAALGVVPTALVMSGPLESPGPDVRARLLAYASSGPSVTTPAEIPAVVVTPPAVAIRSSSLAPWLAVAASLVLSAYLGVDGVRVRHQVADLNRDLQAARAEAATERGRLASLQQAVDRSESAFAVLAAPDVARIELAGQPGAGAGATGRAYWSRARGMVFSANALPPAPAGWSYQVWVVTTAPAPMSAGLIEPDANGRVNVVFSTPSDIPPPQAVAVTLEPAGGRPAPTGPKVLVGLVTVA